MKNISQSFLLKSYLKALTVIELSILLKNPIFIISYNACYVCFILAL